MYSQVQIINIKHGRSASTMVVWMMENHTYNKVQIINLKWGNAINRREA